MLILQTFLKELLVKRSQQILLILDLVLILLDICLDCVDLRKCVTPSLTDLFQDSDILVC